MISITWSPCWTRIIIGMVYCALPWIWNSHIDLFKFSPNFRIHVFQIIIHSDLCHLHTPTPTIWNANHWFSLQILQRLSMPRMMTSIAWCSSQLALMRTPRAVLNMSFVLPSLPNNINILSDIKRSSLRCWVSLSSLGSPVPWWTAGMAPVQFRTIIPSTWIFTSTSVWWHDPIRQGCHEMILQTSLQPSRYVARRPRVAYRHI